MRRFVAIARTAAIETMSQPLSAILFAVAALAIHVLPAFQYHRFGAPGRLARETGLSGLFIFGLLFAVPAIVRTIGRSLETGVAAATLALGVSRPMYFTAHLAGTLFVFAMFFVSVVSATSVSSFSCVKASTILTANGGVVRVWGPALGVGVCGSIAPFAVAALVNRFLDGRFCLWTCMLTVAFQIVGFAIFHDISSVAKVAPALCAISVACVAYVAMAGALSTRLNVNWVSACVAAAVIMGFVSPVGFIMPNMGMFWLAGGDRLAAAPVCAGAALAALWTVVGCLSLERKELG